MSLRQTGNVILAAVHVGVKHLLLLRKVLWDHLRFIAQPTQKLQHIHLMEPFLYLYHGFLYALKLNIQACSQQLFCPVLGPAHVQIGLADFYSPHAPLWAA